MRRWIVVAATGWMGGCGPSTMTPLSEDGTSAGETSAGETGESDGDTATAESGETGAKNVCEEFLDDASGFSLLSIEVRNTGAQAILLPAPCFANDWLELLTDSEWQWPRDFCSGTCEETFASGCFDCGGCASAGYILVPPGESHAVEWDGRLYERMQPPPECFEVGRCAPSCQVARAPTDETIHITVEAITETDCVESEPEPGEACQCPDDIEGPCETVGSALIEPTLLGTAELSPGATGPLVIELAG